MKLIRKDQECRWERDVRTKQLSSEMNPGDPTSTEEKRECSKRRGIGQK